MILEKCFGINGYDSGIIGKHIVSILKKSESTIYECLHFLEQEGLILRRPLNRNSMDRRIENVITRDGLDLILSEVGILGLIG